VRDRSSLGSLTPSGASLTGLLSQDPAYDPVTLMAVADFDGVQLEVTISVDGWGLISTLPLSQPPS
jgi:hypothetical protein